MWRSASTIIGLHVKTAIKSLQDSDTETIYVLYKKNGIIGKTNSMTPTFSIPLIGTSPDKIGTLQVKEI